MTGDSQPLWRRLSDAHYKKLWGVNKKGRTWGPADSILSRTSFETGTRPEVCRGLSVFPVGLFFWLFYCTPNLLARAARTT